MRPGPFGAGVSYLFRHALMRDVAYELQLPRDRATLHSLVISVFEDLHGGRPPLPALLPRHGSRHSSHPLDAVAAELAEHAGFALAAGDSAAMREARRLYLHRAAAHATEYFQNALAETLWEELAEFYDGTEKLECLRLAAVPLGHSARHAEAELRLRPVLHLAREAGDRQAECVLLADLGAALGSQGRREESTAVLEEGLAIARDEGDLHTQGKALANLAVRSVEKGEYDRGVDLNLEALDLFRRLDDKRLMARVLANLTNAYSFDGRIEQAEATCRKALALAREQGDRRIQAQVLSNLAGLLEHQGQDEHVEEYYRDAADLAREVGNPASETFTLGKLTYFLLYHGHFERADAALCRAEQALQGCDLASLTHITRCRRAIYLAVIGDAERARETWKEGSAALERDLRRSYLARVRREMRECCSNTGVPPLE